MIPERENNILDSTFFILTYLFFYLHTTDWLTDLLYRRDSLAHVFQRFDGLMYLLSSRCDRVTVLSKAFMTRQSDYFTFGFTTLNLKQPYYDLFAYFTYNDFKQDKQLAIDT